MASESGYGTYAEVARYLSELTGTTISRQQVYMWHLRRASNGFPEQHDVQVNGTRRSVLMFSLAETEAWLRVYWRTRRPRGKFADNELDTGRQAG